MVRRTNYYLSHNYFINKLFKIIILDIGKNFGYPDELVKLEKKMMEIFSPHKISINNMENIQENNHKHIKYGE